MKSFETPKFSHPGFNFFLRRSSYVHILLVVSTLIGGKVVFNIQQKEREKNLELIQASVRVDMVAMPKYTLNELKNLSSGVEEAKKEEKAPEVVKEAEKVETKIEPKEEPKAEKVAEKNDPTPAFQEAQAAKKRQEFLSKLKNLGNKKVESEGNVKAEKGAYGEKESALKDLVLSGNKLSKGSAMYGDGSGKELTAYQAYKARLPDFVRPHWKLPSFLAGKGLQARVRVWLNMSGEVTRATIYQSSGDNEFDQRAVEAVKTASPFPALSESFGTGAMNGDILLGFPL